MNDSVWVLTQEYNLYDQLGEYFIAVFKHKPTIELLKRLQLSENYAEFLLATGGGRMYGGRKYESAWYFLREMKFDKYGIAESGHA